MIREPQVGDRVIIRNPAGEIARGAIDKIIKEFITVNGFKTGNKAIKAEITLDTVNTVNEQWLKPYTAIYWNPDKPSHCQVWFDVIQVEVSDPHRPEPPGCNGNPTHLDISICHVRVVSDIRITLDFPSDDWIVYQNRYKFDPVDGEIDDWQEVARFPNQAPNPHPFMVEAKTEGQDWEGLRNYVTSLEKPGPQRRTDEHGINHWYYSGEL